MKTNSLLEAGTQADVQRTSLERKRREALAATESTTRQKVEQVADEERFRAQLSSRNAEVLAAAAQLASRRADLKRAKTKLENTRAELLAQKRQRQLVSAGTQVISLVQQRKWVQVNFPEIASDSNFLHTTALQNIEIRRGTFGLGPDHDYQNGAPFLVHNLGRFEVNLKWDVFDFGKRRAAVREREAQLA